MYKKHILKSIEDLLKHQISKNRNNFGMRCNEVIYSTTTTTKQNMKSVCYVIKQIQKCF